MAWKCTGTVTEPTSITGLTPQHPITNKDAELQFNEMLSVIGDLCIGTGPWEVSMMGNGYAYPTSKVSITVTNTSTIDPGVSWDARGPVDISTQIPSHCIPSPAITDPLAQAQYNSCVSAAESIVASKTVGNIRPSEVLLSLDTGEPTATITVIVHRPTAEGYNN